MNKVFEKALVIVSPDQSEAIERLIRDKGLSILQKKRFLLRPEQAQQFLRLARSNSSGPIDDAKDDLKALVDSVPVDVSIIAGLDAVSRWLDLIGQADCISGGVYGSPDVQAAGKEIRFFYPDAKLASDLELKDGRIYLSETVCPLLLKGLVMLVKEKPQIPVLWLAGWLLDNRPHER